MSEPTEDKPRMIRGEDPLIGVDWIGNARRLVAAQAKGPEAFHRTFNEIFPPRKKPTKSPA